MGLTEVLPRLPRILTVLHRLKRAAARRRPVAAILVDIPDFNLRLAKPLKALGIPVAYYISPMVWAWREGRVKTIKQRVDEMMCILPFEEEFYARHGVSARYVGSPVLEQVPEPLPSEHFRAALGLSPTAPTLALLPGSRESEVRRLLPDMLKAAENVARAKEGLQVVIPVAPSISKALVEKHLQHTPLRPVLIDGRAPQAVGASDVAIVASGTATLEAGLMMRPLVVVYRVSSLSYLLGRLLLKVAHVALVNLLTGRRVVPELLQGEMRPEKISREALRLWAGPEREKTLEGLRELRTRLGDTGAAARAAGVVLALLGARREKGPPSC